MPAASFHPSMDHFRAGTNLVWPARRLTNTWCNPNTVLSKSAALTNPASRAVSVHILGNIAIPQSLSASVNKQNGGLIAVFRCQVTSTYGMAQSGHSAASRNKERGATPLLKSNKFKSIYGTHRATGKLIDTVDLKKIDCRLRKTEGPGWLHGQFGVRFQ